MVFLIMFAHALPVFIVAIITGDSIKTNRTALISAVAGLIWGNPVFILLDLFAIGLTLWLVNPYVKKPTSGYNRNDSEFQKTDVSSKYVLPSQQAKASPNEHKLNSIVEEQSLTAAQSQKDNKLGCLIMIVGCSIFGFYMMSKIPATNDSNITSNNEVKTAGTSAKPQIALSSNSQSSNSVKPSSNNTVKIFDNDLRKVQRALKQRGYYDGELDGIYGPITENAIRRFQTNQVIPVTGKADFNTMRALRISVND